MYKNWSDLITPRGLEIDSELLTPTYGKFVAKPLEKGFGHFTVATIRKIISIS